MGAEELAICRAELLRRGLLFPDICHNLFPAQRALVLDSATIKAVLCGRRAGKSFACVEYALASALANPGTFSLYTALTRSSAKRIAWDEPNVGLPAMLARAGVEGKLDNTELSCTLPNKSKIYIMGADDKKMPDRTRGVAFQIAIVDEAAFFAPDHLLNLVWNILRPAMLDRRGTLVLAGSPGIIPKGLFYEITTGIKKGWSVHKWNIYDNPHIRDPKAYLDEERQLHGWTESNPTYRREYLGEWVRDEEILVFKLSDTNLAPTPDNISNLVLGIDFGFNDSTAFVVLGTISKTNKVYTIYAEKESGLTPSQVGEQVICLEQKFGGFAQIVGDTGGLGKGYAEEMRRRFSIPILPALKSDKQGAIELLNGELRDSNLFVDPTTCQKLLDEVQVLPWRYNTATKWREIDPRYESHCADAWLYGYRQVKAWAARLEPTEEQKSWVEEEADRMFETSLRETNEEQVSWEY